MFRGLFLFILIHVFYVPLTLACNAGLRQLSQIPRIGVVDPVSTASLFSRDVFKQTGQRAIHIQTIKKYPKDFAGSFNPQDPYAELIEISWPPTDQDIQRLKDLGVSHLLTGPLSLLEARELSIRLELQPVGATADVLVDKFRQQQVLRDAGLPYIPSEMVKNASRLLRFYEDYGPNVVLKPNDKFGTLNVHFISSRGDLLNTFIDMGSEALIQERIPGVEYFADFVTFYNPLTNQTEHRVVNMARYRKVELVTHAPIYSSIRILPYHGIVQGRIIEQARSALNAFKVESGNTHAEFMLAVDDSSRAKDIIAGKHDADAEKDEPILPIEFNFRMPGGNVPWYARKYAISSDDINHSESAVMAAADPMGFARRKEGWTLRNHLDLSFLFTPKKGRVNLAAILKLQSDYPGIVQEVLPAMEDGVDVDITKDLFGALGKVVIAHPNGDVVTRVSQEIHDRCMNGEFVQ